MASFEFCYDCCILDDVRNSGEKIHKNEEFCKNLISLLTVFILVLLITIHIQVSGLAQNNILDKLKSDSNMGLALLNDMYKGDWAVKDGKLYKGDMLINEDYTLVDEVKKQTDSLATIFMGDTRVSTNVLKEDGSRAIGTKVSDAVANIVLKQGKEYTGQANVVGKVYESKYVPLIDNNGDIIGIWFVGVEKSEVSAAIQSLEINIVITTVIAIIFAILFIIFFTNRIIKSVNKIVAVLTQITSGNFKVKTDIKSRDEMGTIAENLNTMVDTVGTLIRDIKEMSLTVASSSEEMMDSTEQVSTTSEQVTTTIAEIAKGASEQAVSAEKGNAGIQEIVQVLSNIAMDMNTTEELAERARQAVAIGEKSVRCQETKMNENNRVSENVADAITQLSQKSQEIGQILEVIKSIADQTNLLSLNAAIEAARAGDAGKGFAVVAEEIRKLAEQSGKSVKKIGDIINEVQVGVNQAVSEMKKAEVVAGEQSRALEDTVKAFEDISTTVQSITENVKAGSDSSKLLSQNAKQAGENISDIASVSQETAAGMEEVSASTEEQTAIIQHISDSANHLAKLASDLQQKIERFTV